MRISDWSSDVCSSDLEPGSIDGQGTKLSHGPLYLFRARMLVRCGRAFHRTVEAQPLSADASLYIAPSVPVGTGPAMNSSSSLRFRASPKAAMLRDPTPGPEGPRVGEEGVRTGGSRWRSST